MDMQKYKDALLRLWVEIKTHPKSTWFATGGILGLLLGIWIAY